MERTTQGSLYLNSFLSIRGIRLELIKEDQLTEFTKRLPDITIVPPTTHLMMMAIRSRKAKEIMGVKLKDLVVEREIIRPVSNWRARYFNAVMAWGGNTTGPAGTDSWDSLCGSRQTRQFRHHNRVIFLRGICLLMNGPSNAV